MAKRPSPKPLKRTGAFMRSFQKASRGKMGSSSDPIEPTTKTFFIACILPIPKNANTSFGFGKWNTIIPDPIKAWLINLHFKASKISTLFGTQIGHNLTNQFNYVFKNVQQCAPPFHYFSSTFTSTRWFARSASFEIALTRGWDFP